MSPVTYLVTGANRGIGLALVEQLVKDTDAIVYATARNPEKATDLAKLSSEHPGVRIVQLDMNEQSSVNSLAAELPASIDVLIFNAAVNGVHTPMLSAHLDLVSSVFNNNVVGTLRTLQGLAPKIKKSTYKDRRVVIVSTTGGSVTLSPVGLPAYSISKAALHMVGKWTAKELQADGITTVMIHPGWVQTDMGGPQATLTPTQSAVKTLEVSLRVPFEQTGTFWSYQGRQLPW